MQQNGLILDALLASREGNAAKANIGMLASTFLTSPCLRSRNIPIMHERENLYYPLISSSVEAKAKPRSSMHMAPSSCSGIVGNNLRALSSVIRKNYRNRGPGISLLAARTPARNQLTI